MPAIGQVMDILMALEKTAVSDVMKGIFYLSLRAFEPKMVLMLVTLKDT